MDTSPALGRSTEPCSSGHSWSRCCSSTPSRSAHGQISSSSSSNRSIVGLGHDGAGAHLVRTVRARRRAAGRSRRSSVPRRPTSGCEIGTSEVAGHVLTFARRRGAEHAGQRPERLAGGDGTVERTAPQDRAGLVGDRGAHVGSAAPPASCRRRATRGSAARLPAAPRWRPRASRPTRRPAPATRHRCRTRPADRPTSRTSDARPGTSAGPRRRPPAPAGRRHSPR